MSKLLSHLDPVTKSLKFKLLIPFASLMLFVVIFGYYHEGKVNATSRLLLKTQNHQNVLSESQYLLGQLRDTETGQRGYLLTQKESYLEPYFLGVLNTTRSYKKLLEMTTKNEGNNSHIIALKPLIDHKLSELKKTIQFVEMGDSAKALTLVKTDEGKLLMDDIRKNLLVFDNEEQLLLNGALNSYQSSKTQLQQLRFFGVMALFVICGFNVFLINRVVLRPMGQLKSAMKHFSVNDQLSISQVDTQDEIGDVAREFHSLQLKMIAYTQSLKVAKNLAETASKTKSNFLSRVSHELRTPLNAIIGFSAILLATRRHGDLTPIQHAAVNHIRQSGTHLLELINDLLDLAGIEAGKPNVSIATVNPKRSLEECLTMAKSMAQVKAICVEEGNILRDPPNLEIDPVRFKQVFINLITNSIKYNKSHGSIWLWCDRVNNNYLRYFIKDTGMGIAQHDQDKVFEPFVRLPRKEADIQGSGVGLSITKELVELMQGRIGFESVAGEGTTFWVDFLLSEDQSQINTTTLPPSKQLRDQGAEVELPPCSILYIEDNAANAELMQLILAWDEHVELRIHATAERGIEVAKEKRPDIILMDMNLPGISGVEALHLIRQETNLCQIPVIALTADAMPEDIRKAMLEGFNDYQAKPIDIWSFRALLLAHLTQPGPLAVETQAITRISVDAIDRAFFSDVLDGALTAVAVKSTNVLGERFVNILENQLSKLPELLRDMEADIEKNECGDLEQSAHNFKNNARSLGSVRMADLAQEIETMVVENNVIELKPNVQALRLAYVQAKPELNRFVSFLRAQHG